MEANNNTLMGWLVQNDYEDVAELINGIMVDWKTNGNKQRRNWWDILAGDKDGNSRTISGKIIPVLKVAQTRKGIKPTANALCRNQIEAPPIAIKEKHRWSKVKSINITTDI